jgi:hypothetical protein
VAFHWMDDLDDDVDDAKDVFCRLRAADLHGKECQ